MFLYFILGAILAVACLLQWKARPWLAGLPLLYSYAAIVGIAWLTDIPVTATVEFLLFPALWSLGYLLPACLYVFVVMPSERAND